MSTKKGFFCELPVATIAKIRRLAKLKDVAQGLIVADGIHILPDVPPCVRKAQKKLLPERGAGRKAAARR